MFKKLVAWGILFSLPMFAEDVELPLPNGVKMALVKVSKGSFQMGSPADEVYRRDNETAHAVTLSKDYMIGKYEVTQEQYQAVMGTNPSKNQASARHPVDNVSWEEAKAFCGKLTEILHKATVLPANDLITLPTEAQWEYACRAGSKTVFSSGDTLDSSKANFDGNHPYGKTDKSPQYLNMTAAVGSYAPNAWGIHDMHGNVMEWCLDFYQADLGTAAVTDPMGAKDGDYHVYRGGGYRDIGAFCRSAFRYFNLQHFRYGYLGFRVVCVSK